MGKMNSELPIRVRLRWFSHRARMVMENRPTEQHAEYHFTGGTISHESVQWTRWTCLCGHVILEETTRC